MIDNLKAPRVRRVAALARKKDRLAAGQFLVEGPQAVRELLAHAPGAAIAVYATMGGEPWQFEIDRLADEAEVEIVRVSDEVLAAMAETVQPQGVLAVARIEHSPIEAAFASAKLIAVLHEVRDPGNAGTVLRAADAPGLPASHDPSDQRPEERQPEQEERDQEHPRGRPHDAASTGCGHVGVLRRAG